MVNLDDFRSYLVFELKRRQTKNASYSLSAFARDLDMSAQKLSQVLKGRSGLSRAAASQVATHLSLPEGDRDLFLALVDSKHARSELLRKSALQKVETIRARSSLKPVDSKYLEPLGDWASWAAYMLVELKDFEPNVDWAAARLGIPVETCVAIYEKLFSLGLLVRGPDGRWLQVDEKIELNSPTSTQEIRAYYRGVISKSLDAIESVEPTRRHYYTSMFNIRDEDYAVIKNKIDEFSRQLLSEYSSRATQGDHVYCTSIGFFPLDKTEI